MASENFPPCSSTCSLASVKVFLKYLCQLLCRIFSLRKDFINNIWLQRLLASALFL